jgi:hypothetical protein
MFLLGLEFSGSNNTLPPARPKISVEVKNSMAYIKKSLKYF